ncbi:MAG: hypothetical protein LBS51_07575 [Oscillospiraceae bacterium]|jgi:hypothetical protein|nr:hypothetical protein [Oscillospiraceae bacterium]
MKGYKLIFCALGVLAAAFAAIVAISIFKNEIVDFFTAVTDAILDRVGGGPASARKKGEYTDYADV